ncbi:MAG: anaerobic ribonucleoside-triphosphate reductase activating protein [Candidatus Heimdallarchaeota archaeon]|nr:anaerobic ribonucleoside-triphosphate reductase activating protein [Candidatus Heimdallarchaeota archaeon]
MPELEIKGYQQSSMIEWPGLLVDMIFLGGCNLRCPYCHNPDLIPANKVPSYDVNEILAELERRKETGWLDGVSITGGEPTLSKRLPEFLKILGDFGLKRKIDTNGTNPEVVQKILDEGLIEYIAMDVKAIPKSYEKAVGRKVNFTKIRQTIDIIINSDIDHEFRTTVVPTIVTPKDLLIIAEIIAGAKRYYIQEFRPLKCYDKSFETLKPYNRDILEKICEQLKSRFKVCKVR